MTSELINNLTRENHFKRLFTSFRASDEIIIVSPFLSPDFSFFPFKELTNLKKIKLVTTLKPNSLDQYDKVPFFKSLCEYCKNKGVILEILIENSLHGKVYISKLNGKYLEAIITSANFTNNGLRLFNEWGTVITKADQIELLEGSILSRVFFNPITELEVNKFLKILEDNPLLTENNITEINLSDELSKTLNSVKTYDTNNYWLKPIGVSGDFISFDRVFDEIDCDLHFSKVKPTGVKINDIIITYAVGHKKILSIYRVKTEIKTTGKKNDRWPFYVIGENLTPYYGQQWSKYNIGISNLKDEVLGNKISDITPSGKNSYGSLMRGADKLKITPQFGRFITDKVFNIDLEIRTKA